MKYGIDADMKTTFLAVSKPSTTVDRLDDFFKISVQYMFRQHPSTTTFTSLRSADRNVGKRESLKVYGDSPTHHPTSTSLRL